MSAIRGASATSSRSGAWERGWDSAEPPEGMSWATSSAAARIAAADTSSLVAEEEEDVLATKARLDAATNERRGVDGDDRADADDAAATARRREMLNLMMDIEFHFTVGQIYEK